MPQSMDYNQFECLIAATLTQAGCPNAKPSSVFARYREILKQLRQNGGPLQNDIERSR